MKIFGKEEIEKFLPVVISDLKHETTPELKEINPDNIKRMLYFIVVRGVIDEDMGGFYFQEIEKDESHRSGIFVKGYIRDVWDYLQISYENIHNYDYTEICKWQKI